MIPSFFVSPITNLTLFHQNIASILSKQDLFEVTLNELGKDLNGVDFICFTETFMKRGSERNLNIDNFKLVASFCREERRGGTCILIKKELDCKRINIDQALPYSFECCAVEVLQYNLIIVCIYRTPNSNLDIFFQQLQSLLCTLSR